MDFKAQSAPQYGYCKRFATQKAARNTPNPKGWVGKTPFTALCSLKITGYCLRRMPCDWHFSDPAQICNQRQQNLNLPACTGTGLNLAATAPKLANETLSRLAFRM